MSEWWCLLHWLCYNTLSDFLSAAYSSIFKFVKVSLGSLSTSRTAERERPMRHWKLLCLQIGQSTLTVVQRTQHVIMSVSCVMRLRLLRVLSLQPQDRVFYYNASTRVSSWWWSQHPLTISDNTELKNVKCAIVSIVLLQMKFSGHTHWSMCIERRTRPLSVPGTQWLRSWWISYNRN